MIDVVVAKDNPSHGSQIDIHFGEHPEGPGPAIE
jgi:hypothetical protein